MQLDTVVKNQAQKAILPKTTLRQTHSVINFNDLQITCANIHVYLWLFLHDKLHFSHNIREKLFQAMRGLNVV